MTGKPDVRWVDSAAAPMQDVAKLLDTEADLVMAVAKPGGGTDLMVLYTPDYPADETVWEAWLKLDDDGALVVVSREPKPGMWERMKAELDRRLGEGGPA